ncbi:gliding motility-associated C-terminal domain-containing protein [Hymenobacter sp. 15J16-1T3B]|uniref:gliding motility-associated C-terminal domain-containing protein n=1 Tax=Hymenobacter sp. 15J16-1T3B TaxID=2886941 RepID=UPI001D12859A|nr:gliding motility-associated C-terminal domain-containing protein [Hymenobacter sp. 15J16-1T3B]MCC3160701.1 gliding motility-associated C-terminal domain-containing protein [Hymenobacter sp. 15J16-1T3B]
MPRFCSSFLVRAGRLWGLLLCLQLGVLLPARATHIVGGELELTRKSGSTYTLTLNLYFDAVNGNAGALDQQMLAGIFSKATNTRLQQLTLPLTSNTFVNYTNPACAAGSLSTRKLVYSKDIILDAATYTSPAGYYAAVERCCRNLAIGNIVNPGGAAQTFYLEFPAVVQGGQPFLDSTPRIFPPLGDYACLGELFYYDFGGQDADGDSLAYDMVTPLNGHTSSAAPELTLSQPAPYSTITWNAGLSTLNQIPGAPTLGIDARTGRLTVRPSRLGLFVFGVRCAEYRRGVKIGETRRDFQLMVLACPQNAAPTVQLYTPASPRAYRPGRDTLRLTPGTDHCVQLVFTDPDPASQLTLTARPVNYTLASGAAGPTFTTATSGAVRTAGAPDTLRATLCFPDCMDSQGRVYLLDLVVADNGCSLPKRDTVRLAFTARPAVNRAPLLTSSFPPAPADASEPPVLVQLSPGQAYIATLLGTDADNNGLTLTATGQGFDLPAMGMQFAARNGTGRADGSFQWQATCDAASKAELTVVFQLQETATCTPLPQQRTVRFQLVPAPDSVAFLPPNVITPNGDGLNDTFTLPNLPPDFCDQRFAGVRIFSRWGNEVYRSSERTFTWPGGSVAGTYYYLVTYTNGRKFKGWLEVLK